MSRECDAAMRRRTRFGLNVRIPARRLTLLSRHSVAARTFVLFVRVGSTSELGHCVLSTPASGPVMAWRTVACPRATLTVTCPAVTCAADPHDPLAIEKLITCDPATVNV